MYFPLIPLGTGLFGFLLLYPINLLGTLATEPCFFRYTYGAEMAERSPSNYSLCERALSRRGGRRAPAGCLNFHICRVRACMHPIPCSIISAHACYN